MLDRDRILGRFFLRRLEARDFAILAQAAHLTGSEWFAVGGLAVLAVQNAGDDIIGVMSGQTAQQCDLSSSVRGPECR